MPDMAAPMPWSHCRGSQSSATANRYRAGRGGLCTHGPAKLQYASFPGDTEAGRRQIGTYAGETYMLTTMVSSVSVTSGPPDRQVVRPTASRLQLLVPTPRDGPAKGPGRPIEEILAELAAEVPPEEWARLPADLTDNMDHYLYGTPKR